MQHQNLSRREVMGLMAAAGFSPAAMAAAPKGRGYSEADYRRSMLIDAQGPFVGQQLTDATLSDIKASGMTAGSLTMGQVGNGPGRMESVVADIARVDGWIDSYPDVLRSIRKASHLASAKSSGRMGLIYNTQDTYCLEGEVSRVRFLKNLGIRIIQLTYNKRNLCGDGCLEPGDAGISDFGREVIGAVNEARMLLDLSHAGRRTMSEAAQFSKAPPAVTHTACRNLVNNQRNLYDDQMKEIADRGGVVGIYLIAYLRSGIGQPALNARGEDLIAHVEHAAKVCGEDHIGIGTDGGISTLVIDQAALDAQKARYEQRVSQGFATAGEGPDVFNYVPEYNSPRRYLTIGQDLAKRGWPTRRIEKLLGGNFARLFGEVWDA